MIAFPNQRRFWSSGSPSARKSIYLGGISELEALKRLSVFYADFTTGTYSGPALTCIRASSAYVEDLAGNWTLVPANTLRRSNKGVLVEESRVNRFLNPSTPVTQTVTVVNGTTYTVSLYASGGTLTLSGAGSGIVNANGAVTFVASGTSLTVTVSGVTGAFTHVNVEAGAFKTSPIPGGASPATRAADVITAPLIVSGPVTLIAIGSSAAPNSGQQVLGSLTDGSGSNQVILRRAAGAGQIIQTVAGSAVAAPVASGAWNANERHALAAAFAAGDQAVSLDGGTVATASGAGFPTLTNIAAGATGNGTVQPLNGSLERFIVLPYRAPNTELRRLSQLSTWGG